MKKNSNEDTNRIIKIIDNKKPPVSSWLMIALGIVLCNFLAFENVLPDIVFYIFSPFAFFCVCLGIYLVLKYWGISYVQTIKIYQDNTIDISYYRDIAGRGKYYYTSKSLLSVQIGRNKMKFYQGHELVAKLYKNTLRNNSDWDWLISYFDKV